MLIFPAIDIKNGTCVRLYQGEMSTAEQVANSALEAAGAFKAAGASWVHMVDLDGAVEGVRKNTGIFLEVVQESGLKVEVGGGIRTMTDIAFYLENGISRVILGSIALRDALLGPPGRGGIRRPDCCGHRRARRHGGRRGLGGNERGQRCGACKAHGGCRRAMPDLHGYRARRMLSGPNLGQLTRIQRAVKCDIVASGGVTNLSDIAALRDCGLYGAICGRSIYKGTLSLREAIQIADIR